jgi:hypothetical protein
MTPKEKAEELVGKYYFQVFNLNQQKQCALICVDELMKDNAINEEIVNGGLNFQYWKEVKQQIELL